MASKNIATLVFVSFLMLPPSISSYSSAEIKSWCSQTPHPEPCEYFMSNNPKYKVLPLKQKSDFFKLSVQLALDHCVHAQNNVYSLGPKCRNEHEKAAWTDCVELYDHTIHKINKTIDPNTNPTAADAQTWLSTALTNLETCRDGFVDLGVANYNVVGPLISNNVSLLLSNALALNKVAHESASFNKVGFPSWVGPGYRKLLRSSNFSEANAVVAQDGSGEYRTVGAAIAAVGKRPSGSGRHVIYVKQGVYSENVNIEAQNIMLLGDGIGKTIITGSRSVGGGSTTLKSATVAVVGDRFIARGITFRNTAGARNHQAVALRSGSDLSVFYQCSFEGYQDTLYVHSERQFYRECDIYGTVDFMFGNAAAVFQNCNIYPRDPPNKTNTITAQGRTDPNQNTGISIHNCRVTAAPDLRPVQGSVKTYLGRPWKQYSRTVFTKTYLDGLIAPAGWMPWSGNFALNTLYYGEYANTGPGSSTTNRVKWKGYRVITSASEASKFTVETFIDGNSWLPAANVPFTPGL